MRRVSWIAFAAVAMLASDGPGIRPRAQATDYPAHAAAGGVTIAVAVLPADKVQKLFSADVVKAGYTVMEAAVYPDAGKEIDVSSDDFTLRIGSDPDTARAEPPAVVVVAAAAPDKTPVPQVPGKVTVHTQQTVGYSTGGGYDPATGRRYPGGVYTDTQVGVGVGNPGAGGAPPPPPAQNRDDRLRQKLEDKALPEGKTAKPVAGYLYFAKATPKLKSLTFHVIYSGPTGQMDVAVPLETK